MSLFSTEDTIEFKVEYTET